ncbi:release factor [Dacryopinax primogenitus]|uniref:Release factor n=1 Tax=Dacryopinax primogenitus (strain DJM 731) TaxID=1858805 RepID=M5FRE5_DACPD|nr:release factor [Dacryopinax primogenitus]EJT99680.1 release factor [Dacryopinax primogenitus]
MLFLSRRWCTTAHSIIVYRQWKRVASTAVRADPSLSLWRERFGEEGERILKIVSRRVAERNELIQLLGGNAHSPEQIQRAKTAKELEPLWEAWQDWQKTEGSFDEVKVLLEDSDPDIRMLAQEDEAALTSKLNEFVSGTFPTLLMPASKTSHYTALVEIKAGVGGDESALFAEEMSRLYTRFATTQDWQCQVVSETGHEHGGIREIIIEIKGDGTYDEMRWENGVHRVQRVPATESTGRVHTSTISVMVFPVAPQSGHDAVEEDIVDEKDVRIDVMRARGAGGQHVNRTESAVRLVHIPTGITVSMQDSRSQHQNRARAWEILRARLLDRKLAADAEKKRLTRRSIFKSADRSEKVRTYNFPQDRVTDHRIGMTLKNLESFMDGTRLHDVHEALIRDYNAAELEELLESGTSH